MRAVHETGGGHALQHHRGGRLVVHIVGEHHDVLGRHGADADVGAGRHARIGDAVSRQEVDDIGSGVDNHAGRLHPEERGWLDQPVQARAHVDVDVVDAHGRLADAHLARSRWSRRPCLMAEHVGAAERGHDDALRSHGASRRGPDRSRGARGARCRVPRLSQVSAQAVEASFIDAGADKIRQLPLPARRRVEGALPVPECALAVRHPLELHRGDVPPDRQRRVEDAVRRDMLPIREGQQLLPDPVAVPQREAPHAAHLVRRLSALDLGLGHHRMPRGVTVEIAEHVPDALDRCVDHGGPGYADHGSAVSAGTSPSARRSRPGRRPARCSGPARPRARARSRTRSTTPQRCGCRP